MKWLALPLLGLMATAANAQEAEKLAIGVVCGQNSPQAMLEERYGEIPMLEGQATVLGGQGEDINGELTMYVNPETKTYSIQFSVADELYCIIASGADLHAAVAEDGI
jgi:hypothetical protein